MKELKINELRIGNLVQGPKGAMYDGAQIQVTPKTMLAIHSDGIELRPIPLTEQWLLNFNLNPKGEGYSIYSYLLCSFTDFSDGSQEYTLYDWDSFNDIEVVIATQIKYVHQLQNLIFALTNEELHENNTSQS